MRTTGVTIARLGLIAAALAGPPRAPAQEIDEIRAHLADVQRQVDDDALPIERREELALEMAATLDRAAQAAPQAEARRARWAEAIALLDAFRGKSPDHPRAREFYFQAAVYAWARAQSWSQQWEYDPSDAAARAAAVKELGVAIDRLRWIVKTMTDPGTTLAQNVRFRLAQALADRAALAGETDADAKRRDEDDALSALEPPIEEPTLQGFVALLRGDLLDRAGRHGAAADELDSALRLPSPPPAALWLPARVSVFLHQGRAADALRAIERSPADATTKRRLALRVRLAQLAELPPGKPRDEVESRLFAEAEALKTSKDPAARQALGELSRSVAEPGPEQGPGAWEALAEGWLARGDPTRAADLLERAARGDGGDAGRAAALRLRAGALLYQAGKLTEADRVLSGLIDDPAAGASRAKAGLLRILARGQRVAAQGRGASSAAYLAALEAQVRDFPDDPATHQARWLLGRERLESGDPAGAEAIWTTIPPGGPAWLDARLAVARLRRARLDDLRLASDREPFNRMVEAARSYLHEGLSLARSDGERAEIDLELARLNLSPGVGRADEARQICEGILRTPGQAARRDRARWLNLVALAQLNRFVEAEDQARAEAARATPEELVEAARMLDHSVADSPSDLRLRRHGLLMLIVLAPALDGPRELPAELRAEAQLRRTRGLLFSGDDAAARRSLAAWNVKPESAGDALLRDLADTFTRLDAHGLALDVQRLRMQQNPSGSPRWFEARYGLALALYRSGKTDEARKLIDATSILYPDLGGPILKPRYEHLRRRIGDGG